MTCARLLKLTLPGLLLLTAVSCTRGESLDSFKSEPGPASSCVSQSSQDTDPIQVPMPFVNPLTGEGCETDIGKNRPIAVMLNNLKKAMPQLGVGQADIIYEIPAEGGITRMMGVFQSVDGVGEIGTVRSARDYYVSLADGHDAIYLHAGGSPQAYGKIKEWGITAMDCVNGPYEGTLFWRDQQRRKKAGLEHSVLTSGDKIQELFPTYTKLRTEHKDNYSCPWTFAEDAVPVNGERADTITIKFSYYKTGVFQYDGDSGRYYVEQYDAPYVDGNTGEQVSVKNVLILKTDIYAIKGDEAGRLSVRTTGEGKGLFACGGRIEEITWSKPRHNAPMTFRTADGRPLNLGIGNSYINLIGSDSSVQYE